MKDRQIKQAEDRSICPYSRELCMKSKCVCYRQGIRYFDDPERPPESIEDCGFNILVDAAESQINRLLGVQEEINILRNEAHSTVQALMLMGKMKKEIEAKIRDEAKKLTSSGDEVDGKMDGANTQ